MSQAGAGRGASDKAPLRFALGVWGALLTVVLLCIAKFGRNIPLAEDWLLVAPLTGHEPNLLSWAWAQNNEHRLPLPRLAHLALLLLTGGDFRCGMVFSALAMGALSLAMMWSARWVRGGRTAYSDAFFPMLFLHLGHWPSFIWSGQIQFTVSTAATSTFILVVCRLRNTLAWPMTVLGSLALVALPLSGASGLAFVPPMAFGATALGVSCWRRARGKAVALILSSFAAITLTGLYFLEYERPSWNPPSPGISATLATAAKLLALGLGPAASLSWKVSFLVVGSLLSASAALLILHLRQRLCARITGFLLFFSGGFVLLLGIGWGRAGLMPEVGLPMRYAILIAPILACSYFVWEIYGPGVATRVVQYGLLVTTSVLLPFNVRQGLTWRDWYVSGMKAVEEDLRSGVPPEELAARHRSFLLHWDETGLATYMHYLQEAGLGPFGAMREDP